PVALLQQLKEAPGGVVLNTLDHATDLEVAIRVVRVGDCQCHARLPLDMPIVVALLRMRQPDNAVLAVPQEPHRIDLGRAVTSNSREVCEQRAFQQVDMRLGWVHALKGTSFRSSGGPDGHSGASVRAKAALLAAIA